MPTNIRPRVLYKVKQRCSQTEQKSFCLNDAVAHSCLSSVNGTATAKALLPIRLQVHGMLRCDTLSASYCYNLCVSCHVLVSCWH